jgi:hypothetical protein
MPTAMSCTSRKRRFQLRIGRAMQRGAGTCGEAALEREQGTKPRVAGSTTGPPLFSAA